MDVRIQEVVTNRELSAFIHFPIELYKGSACYVPSLTMDEFNTLRRDKNPAFDHCEAKYWLAYDGQGKVVGRVAAIINRLHLEKWNQPYMRFGWLDFVDDPAVSAALMGAVEAWAKEKGMTAVHGPLGFTDMDREGMLIDGFDELGTLSTYYNYPYYSIHMEQHGYTKDVDWQEYEITVPKEPNETISKAAAIIAKRNKLTLKFPASRKELKSYAQEIFGLINAEYEHLYGTVPLTPRQIAGYTDQYLGFLDPGLTPLVFDEAGRLVAFGIVLPSLARALQKSKGDLFPFGFIHLMNALRKSDILDLALVAVKSELQGKGVNALLIDALSKKVIARGFKTIETNPELETNLAVQTQWKYFQVRPHKRRRCYIKQLN